MNLRIRFGRTVLAGFLAVGGAACALASLPVAAKTEAAQDSSKDIARALSDAFEQAAEKIRPSVVSISVVKQAGGAVRLQQVPLNRQMPEGFDELFGGSLLDELFGGRGMGNGQWQAPRQESFGSGFLIDEDGTIVTNHHVVQDAIELRVHLEDGRDVEATVLGTDPKTDLALIDIDAEGLVPARFGSSRDLRVGEWVVAAGSPFGLQSSITAGIVSAIGRSRVDITQYEDFIQTDAAINPGNSGGPLINLDGEVVGINTAIFSRSGAYNGIGLAIPAHLARPVIESLQRDGRVVRGFLGVYLNDLDANMAASFGYEGKIGVLVEDVSEGGPAASSGLRSGDIIQKYGGVEVSNVEDFRLDVAGTPPGRKVELLVFRDGSSRKLNVVIGELEAEQGPSGAPQRAPAQESRFGLQVQDLTPELAQQLGFEATTQGVLVVGVERFGEAERAGIRKHDVILYVGNDAVAGLDEFRELLEKNPTEPGVRLLTVRRGGTKRYVWLPR